MGKPVKLGFGSELEIILHKTKCWSLWKSLSEIVDLREIGPKLSVTPSEF